MRLEEVVAVAHRSAQARCTVAYSHCQQIWVFARMDYKVKEVEHAALVKMFIVYMQMQSNVRYQCDDVCQRQHCLSTLGLM